jgi:hypothetical protein
MSAAIMSPQLIEALAVAVRAVLVKMTLKQTVALAVAARPQVFRGRRLLMLAAAAVARVLRVALAVAAVVVMVEVVPHKAPTAPLIQAAAVVVPTPQV